MLRLSLPQSPSKTDSPFSELLLADCGCGDQLPVVPWHVHNLTLTFHVMAPTTPFDFGTVKDDQNHGKAYQQGVWSYPWQIFHSLIFSGSYCFG